jgi:hypothetical protein
MSGSSRLISLATLVGTLLALTSASGQTIHPNPPVHPPFKTCDSIKNRPNTADHDCTSSVKPNSSVICTVTDGGATACHVTFSPSKTEWHLAKNNSAGNGKDDTVQLTCDGTPAGPYGMRCLIQIRPNPDHP